VLKTLIYKSKRIHGLSNKPSKGLLEKWWRQSISEGLKNVYGDDAPDFRFELVYWADILHETPLDEDITDANNPLYIAEPYKKGLSRRKYVVKEKRKKNSKSLLKFFSHLLLNKDLSINYTYITDAIVHKYYKDLEAYYYRKKEIAKDEVFIKDLIRKRLIRILKKYENDEILLLAHSMGSIIAYDVLSYYGKEFNIDTFLTFGSPLGFPVVIGKIAEELKLKQPDLKRLTTPESVASKWSNFSDIEDKVAIYDQLANDFDMNSLGVKVVDTEVFNDYRLNKEVNPHKSFGYLRTEEIAKAIFEFAYGEKPILKKRFRLKFLKFLIDIKIKTKKKK